MNEEKRNGDNAIPDNLEDHLNDLQQVILDKINKFGWTLKFVRTGSGSQSVIAIEDQDGKKIGVLEEDGNINFETGMEVREY